MLQLVLMNRESDFMGLDPYKLDPEYWVEKIKSSTFNRRNNSTLTLFCMTTIIFQTIINSSTILFEFLPKNVCVTNFVVRECCLSSAILDSVSLFGIDTGNRNTRCDVE
jgi:hypothetical protein